MCICFFPVSFESLVKFVWRLGIGSHDSALTIQHFDVNRLVTTLAYFKARESEQIMHSWARTGRMRRKMRICYQDVFQGDWEEINLVPRELTKWTDRKHQANRKLAKIPFPGHY